MNREDEYRLSFLNRLSRSNVPLTEWESKFTDDMLDGEGDLRSYSDRQREKIDQMRKRYEREL